MLQMSSAISLRSGARLHISSVGRAKTSSDTKIPRGRDHRRPLMPRRNPGTQRFSRGASCEVSAPSRDGTSTRVDSEVLVLGATFLSMGAAALVAGAGVGLGGGAGVCCEATFPCLGVTVDGAVCFGAVDDSGAVRGGGTFECAAGGIEGGALLDGGAFELCGAGARTGACDVDGASDVDGAWDDGGAC